MPFYALNKIVRYYNGVRSICKYSHFVIERVPLIYEINLQLPRAIHQSEPDEVDDKARLSSGCGT